MAAASPLAWLPRDAIAAAAERLAVREMVSDWSAKWFGQSGASLTGFAAATGDAAAAGEAIELEGITATIPADAAAAIGVLMVGALDAAATAADRAAIAAGAEQAIADLQQRAAQLVGLPRDAAWRVPRGGRGAGYDFTIRVGPASLTLSVADRLLIAGIKMRLRPAVAMRPIGDIAAGLALQRIALSARLGACRLAMAELAALAIGDVVVLDRALDDPAELVVDRVPQRAACTVAAGTDHLDLTLA